MMFCLKKKDASEDEISLQDAYVELYSDVIESLYEKPSKWRIMYERTGQLDWKFKGEKKMLVRVEDFTNLKLKFLDEKKTRLNVKDSTNNLILAYQSKKLKKIVGASGDDSTSTKVMFIKKH